MSLVEDAQRALGTFRNDDGGFGLQPEQPSEPEATALAALALNDHRARDWLGRNQRDDGSYGLVPGPFTDHAATPLAALTLGPGVAREAALDHLERTRGRRVVRTDAIPLDPDVLGWSWTARTASWVEPTARALWALRLLRPGSSAIREAIALLADRESIGGGWNYGNPEVLGERLPPFAQTTAIALIGLRGMSSDLEDRGLGVLRRLWTTDVPGPLTLAMCEAAFKMHGDPNAAAATRSSLHDMIARSTLQLDAVTWSWIVLGGSDRLPGVGP